MKMWPESPGAVTTLRGAVSVGPTGFPNSSLTPLVTSSIPTLGPKLVMGANRVASYGFQGGWAYDRAAPAMMNTTTSAHSKRIRWSIRHAPCTRCTSRRSHESDAMEAYAGAGRDWESYVPQAFAHCSSPHALSRRAAPR